MRDGYEAVYDALPQGETFGRIWRDNAYRGEFPIEFAHIGFLTLSEAQRMLDALHLNPGGVLVDLACGPSGPGLWAAQQWGASLIGIDPARRTHRRTTTRLRTSDSKTAHDSNKARSNESDCMTPSPTQP